MHFCNRKKKLKKKIKKKIEKKSKKMYQILKDNIFFMGHFLEWLLVKNHKQNA